MDIWHVQELDGQHSQHSIEWVHTWYNTVALLCLKKLEHVQQSKVRGLTFWSMDICEERQEEYIYIFSEYLTRASLLLYIVGVSANSSNHVGICDHIWKYMSMFSQL